MEVSLMNTQNRILLTSLGESNTLLYDGGIHLKRFFFSDFQGRQPQSSLLEIRIMNRILNEENMTFIRSRELSFKLTSFEKGKRYFQEKVISLGVVILCKILSLKCAQGEKNRLYLSRSKGRKMQVIVTLVYMSNLDPFPTPHTCCNIAWLCKLHCTEYQTDP